MAGIPGTSFGIWRGSAMRGSHFLASNLWAVGHTPRDYLHPMFAISGLLWRLGVSVQLAFWCGSRPLCWCCSWAALHTSGTCTLRAIGSARPRFS